MQHTFPAPAGFEQVPVFAAEDVAAAALQPFRYDRDASQTSTDFKWVVWKDPSHTVLVYAWGG